VISKSAFRETLAHFASGVTIVTSRHATGLVGFTATGFTSVSLEPPLILVCVDKSASAYEGIVTSQHFGVSILGEAQSAIALQFARHGVDRFEGIALRGTWAPLIEGALAHLECKNHSQQDAGDHTLVLGEVLDGAVGSGRPLLHFARRFGGFVPDK
jgi:flavin reductase ActVB